jgi:hypothetical protein
MKEGNVVNIPWFSVFEARKKLDSHLFSDKKWVPKFAMDLNRGIDDVSENDNPPY